MGKGFHCTTLSRPWLACERSASPFFAGLDWRKLEKRELKPPFLPKVLRGLGKAKLALSQSGAGCWRTRWAWSGPQVGPDGSNFDPEFTKEEPRLTPPEKRQMVAIDQVGGEGGTPPLCVHGSRA